MDEPEALSLAPGATLVLLVLSRWPMTMYTWSGVVTPVRVPTTLGA